MRLFKKKSMPTDSIKIGLKHIGSLFYIVVRSRTRLKLLLDSGASNTQIAIFALSKCTYERTGEVFSTYGVGGSIKAERMCLSLSTIDNSYTKTLMLAHIVDNPDFCLEMRKLHVDGLLGMDFLKGCMIDLSGNMLVIPNVK